MFNINNPYKILKHSQKYRIFEYQRQNLNKVSYKGFSNFYHFKIFVLLIYLVRSEWLNYSYLSLSLKMLHSKSKPIFVLFFSPHCGHCSGIPEALHDWANDLGRRKDIYITQIDCYNTYGCIPFGIDRTPTQVLIIGNNKKYWPNTYYRDGKDWDLWVNQTWTEHLHEIDPSDLYNETLQTRNGGSTFYLQVPSKDSPILKKVAQLSRYYSIFHCNFVYSINISLKSPQFYAYQSPYCFHSYSFYWNLQSFIEKYKFSAIHQFDSDEFFSYHSKPSAILYTRAPISDGQIDSLVELTKNCEDSKKKDYIYGWYDDSNDNKKTFLKQLGINDHEIPFLIGTGGFSG